MLPASDLFELWYPRSSFSLETTYIEGSSNMEASQLICNVIRLMGY